MVANTTYFKCGAGGVVARLLVKDGGDGEGTALEGGHTCSRWEMAPLGDTRGARGDLMFPHLERDSRVFQVATYKKTIVGLSTIFFLNYFLGVFGFLVNFTPSIYSSITIIASVFFS